MGKKHNYPSGLPLYWWGYETSGRLRVIATLRERVKGLKTSEDMAVFLWDCLALGIDPL